jgi:predicted DNA-binding transcriptional regulator AlpA
MIKGKNYNMKNLRGYGLSFSKVAKLIGVSTRWMEMHYRDGTLPFNVITVSERVHIIDSADIDDWVASRKETAA